jgi:hypothetical protein
MWTERHAHKTDELREWWAPLAPLRGVAFLNGSAPIPFAGEWLPRAETQQSTQQDGR